jgi:uncharacterized protein (DUF2336 family)
MSPDNNLVSELESAMMHGTAERRAKTLQRITDLFVFGSGNFSNDHVALFDGVFGHLIAHIELSARAALANRLADVANAPPLAIRALAFDDVIEVAGPVLTRSERLDNAALAENASTKSQQHLLAISRRKALDEVITDILIERGDEEVALSTASNFGAKLSEAGFSRLVERSEGDDRLAQSVGSRPEIPRHHFLKLLTKASQAVRQKLEAADPHNAQVIKHVVAEVATSIQAKVAAKSRDYAAARALVDSLWEARRLAENDVAEFARAGRFEETTAALAVMSNLPIDAVERAMVQEQPETIVIVAKALGLSWATVKAILLLRAGGRKMPAHTLDQCLAVFSRLKRETAQAVIDFQRKRQKAAPTPA